MPVWDLPVPCMHLLPAPLQTAHAHSGRQEAAVLSSSCSLLPTVFTTDQGFCQKSERFMLGVVVHPRLLKLE